MIRVLLADDHALIRSGGHFGSDPEIEVVGQVDDEPRP